MASMRSIKPYTGRRKREERKNGPMPEMELVSDINMFNSRTSAEPCRRMEASIRASRATTRLKSPPSPARPERRARLGALLANQPLSSSNQARWLAAPPLQVSSAKVPKSDLVVRVSKPKHLALPLKTKLIDLREFEVKQPQVKVNVERQLKKLRSKH
eukprot:CAMPEP_0185624034 /NCGR_PEP_ID=MMETSP0436-20130131/60307_1 /TAXON_ID=626734 ORGANISM="Favella taraikaensis, Strain Fe Narragansett Bay" /NCGR_SAMPLE_ID=MMETSP0436 /ASSEMBLY_ACC=CAM_ASM_000390 /LENGTH=157 /DNA_ID=CAMNT_0028266337 /DNA_START=863 /DNA_END=1337 /DNA_ORIENTATION=+